MVQKKSFEALDRVLALAGFTQGQVTCIHVIPFVPEGDPRTKAFDKQLQDDGKILLKKASSMQETRMSNYSQIS